MVKIIMIFTFLICSTFNSYSDELEKEVLIKIQDKLLACILETINKEIMIVEDTFKTYRLKYIYSNIEKSYLSQNNFISMNVLIVDSIYKVKLNLSTYKSFIVDSNIILNYKKLGQRLDYSHTFEKYFITYSYDASYISNLITIENFYPIICYVKIVDNEVVVLKSSEIKEKYIELDSTKSFFINENCR